VFGRDGSGPSLASALLELRDPGLGRVGIRGVVEDYQKLVGDLRPLPSGEGESGGLGGLGLHRLEHSREGSERRRRGPVGIQSAKVRTARERDGTVRPRVTRGCASAM
jgi:hypothetical protein